MKYNEFYEQVYSQDTIEEKPYGRIQWKGTEVCADLHCTCGEFHHFDGEFLYFFECPSCNKKYAIGRIIKLIPLNEEQIEHAKNWGFKTCNPVTCGHE